MDILTGIALGVIILAALAIFMGLLGIAARVVGYGFRKGWRRAAPRVRTVHVPPRPYLPTSTATHLQLKGVTTPMYPPITQEPYRYTYRDAT